MLPRHHDIGLSRRIFEALCILTAVALLLVHVGRLVVLPSAFSWWSLILGAAGVAAADLASGLIHWAADTWGRESMPVLGPRLLHPFRVHHVNPDDFLRRSFLDVNGDVAAAVLPFLVGMFWIPLDDAAGRGCLSFMLGFSAAGLATNQVHQWAHMRHPPRPVRLLQDARLILSRGAHQRHHGAPYATDYCIATGWCNVTLNRINFFRRLERLIVRATGWTPREDDAGFHAAASPVADGSRRHRLHE